MKQTGLIRPHHSKLALLHKLIDTTLLLLSYLLVVTSDLRLWQEQDTLTVLMAAIVFYLCASANGLYRSWRISSLSKEISKILISWVLTATLLLGITLIVGVEESYLNISLLVWILSVPVALAISRVILRFVTRNLRKKGFNSRKVAIVGCTRLGEDLASHITENKWMGLRFTGFFDDRKNKDGRITNSRQYDHIGGLDSLLSQAHNGEVDLIIIALPFQAEVRIKEFILDCSDTTTSIYIAQDFESFHMLHGRWSMFGDVPVVSIVESPFYDIDGLVKRIEDIVFGAIIAAVALLPCLLIALAVKLTSPGPVIFKQRRFGLNGQEIYVYKFRTMYCCDDGENIQQATKCDQRITRVGKILRQTSLDELPQLINVIQGNMSLIGPRPHAVIHNQKYRKLIGCYMLRHKVKPGITGWAQVNGWRGETDTIEKMEQRIRYDLEYIRRWSLFFDVRILCLTVYTGFTGKNAY